MYQFSLEENKENKRTKTITFMILKYIAHYDKIYNIPRN